MKKIIFLSLFALSAFLLVPASAGASAYEASGLFNSVGRSETVQDLFFERWETVLDKQLLVDWYGKINWLNNFKVNTINGATGQRESIPMTLVRTYGSLSILLGGDGIGTRIKKAMAPAKKADAADEAAETEEKLVSTKRLQVGLTMTGFHYGLTRDTNVDRGRAGSETVSDYRFTQFFDDMFVLSLIYTPYIYVHGGLMINNQIEPNDDGTMSYTKPKNGYPEYRWFFASNILSFLNSNATVTKGKLEKISAGADFTKCAGMLTSVPSWVPHLTVTGKQLNLFNDKAYDAVWVKSAYIRGTALQKNSDMSDDSCQSAKLYTLSFLVTEDLKNIFFADFLTELQYCPVTLIEKRTITTDNPSGEKLSLDSFREVRGSVGLNVFGFNKENIDSLKFSLGLGRYWDPSIAVHRTSGSGHALLGYFGSIQYERPYFGGEVNVSYNYSKELRKLVEAADKLALEGSLFLRF